jgi:hypothetical protein
MKYPEIISRIDVKETLNDGLGKSSGAGGVVPLRYGKVQDGDVGIHLDVFESGQTDRWVFVIGHGIQSTPSTSKDAKWEKGMSKDALRGERGKEKKAYQRGKPYFHRRRRFVNDVGRLGSAREENKNDLLFRISQEPDGTSTNPFSQLLDPLLPVHVMHHTDDLELVVWRSHVPNRKKLFRPPFKTEVRRT